VGLGLIASRAGDTEAARDQFGQAVAVPDEQAQTAGLWDASHVLQFRAVALLGLGKRAEALGLLRQAVAMPAWETAGCADLYQLLQEAPRPPEGLADAIALLRAAAAGDDSPPAI
jgi:hypothetical protein